MIRMKLGIGLLIKVLLYDVKGVVEWMNTVINLGLHGNTVKLCKKITNSIKILHKNTCIIV